MRADFLKIINNVSKKIVGLKVLRKGWAGVRRWHWELLT